MSDGQLAECRAKVSFYYYYNYYFAVDGRVKTRGRAVRVARAAAQRVLAGHGVNNFCRVVRRPGGTAPPSEGPRRRLEPCRRAEGPPSPPRGRRCRTRSRRDAPSWPRGATDQSCHAQFMPPKSALPARNPGPSLNTWLIESPGVHGPNGIWIASAVFAVGLASRRTTAPKVGQRETLHVHHVRPLRQEHSRLCVEPNQTRQSQTADSAPVVATWEVTISTRKVVPYVRWPATGISAHCL